MRILSLVGVALVGGFLLSGTAWATEDLAVEDLIVEKEFKRNAANIAFGYGSLWVAAGFKVLRIDAAKNEITEIELEGATQKQRRVAVGEGAVWIPDVGKGVVFKIDPESSAVVAEIPVKMLSTQGSIGIGEGSVWVVTAEAFEKTVARYNAQSGELEASITLPAGGTGVAVDFGSVWVTSNISNALYRIDPDTNAVASTTKLGDAPRFVTTGEGSVWVHNQGDSTVQRIDGATGELLATIETGLPKGAGDIDVGGGYVWLNAPYQVVVAQIDPETNKLVHRYIGKIGGEVIRFGSDSLWVGGPSIRRISPPK